MEPTILRTPRLELHPTSPDFFDGLWAASEASQAELAPWMAWAVDHKPAAARAFTEGAVESWSSGAAYNFTLVYDGEVSGQCSLNRVDSLTNQSEIGYWVHSNLSGRGLMTEAAAVVIDFGFTRLSLHRVELCAGLHNIASNRVAQKLGFRVEGVARERGLGAGGYYDMNVYGLLEGDPRLRPS